MTYTQPTTSASPGRAYFDLPFQPLTAIPEPLRLAGQMLVVDLLKAAGVVVLLGGIGGILLMSAAIASHNLPAAIGMVLVTCFGTGLVGYVSTKARAFGGEA